MLKDNADTAISWQHIIDGPVPPLQILGKHYLLTTLEQFSEMKELAGYGHPKGIALQTSFLSCHVHLCTVFSQSTQLFKGFIP